MLVCVCLCVCVVCRLGCGEGSRSPRMVLCPSPRHSRSKMQLAGFHKTLLDSGYGALVPRGLYTALACALLP